MKKLNLKNWLTVFTLGMLVACGTEGTNVENEVSFGRSYKKANYSDAEWVEKITGTWMSAEVSQITIDYHEKTYFADMTSCGFFHDAGYVFDTRVGLFRGTWEIGDGILISVVDKATSNTLLEEGIVIKDKIISVDEDIMILQSMEYGSIYRRYRLKQPRYRANCKLWENFDIDADDYDEDAKVKT